MPNFSTKKTLFSYFWVRILRNYCRIRNQYSQICLTKKFSEKTKIPTFGTKNASFGYFLGKILKKYCHIINKHPQIYRILKFHEKRKNEEICDQKCLIWLSLDNIFKKLFSYLELASKILGKE